MKQWIYPLMIIFAASCYGILSTIIKLAIQDGFTAAEAVTAQYFTGFILALIIFIVVRHKIPKFSGGITLLLAGLFTATTGTVYGQAVTYMPASIAVVMLFQFTWIGMLFDCIERRRLPKRIEVISLLFLLGGTIFAAGVIGTDISTIPWQGWAWGMASAVSFASFVMINQRQVEGMDTETRLLFTSFFAAVAIFFVQSPRNRLERNIIRWRSLDLRTNLRLIRHRHSDLFVFNCGSKSRHCYSFHIKCDGTSSSSHSFSHFIKRSAHLSTSDRNYNYPDWYDFTHNCRETLIKD